MRLLILKNFYILSVAYFFASTHAARFDITNSCSFVVWAAAVPVGGRQLNPGQTWHLDTGDCGGLLECRGYGQPPNTLAEYSLNQYKNLDFFDISLVDGFNVRMDFSPTSPQCKRGPKCVANINGECPAKLKAPGGCNNPCTVFKTDQYCCNSGSCGPTDYSRFFKTRCPDAYSYPKDDQTSTFTCPGGTNSEVVFCAN
ncbi:Thaumatin [Trema orientale]|uniref:Thaumatin n=1 Tax=Trema orientale TaxID=63057 RepID=A0A2P5ELM2_TREOI|nr:Thaumatin [Trema orientale]